MVYDGVILFPNGSGYRECSADYEKLHDRMTSLHERYMDVDWEEPGNGSRYSVLYNDYHSVLHELDVMQGEGHLGKVIRY